MDNSVGIVNHTLGEDSKLESMVENKNPSAKTKAKKQRKSQPEEEYQLQYKQFTESGPRINKDDWLVDAISLDHIDKDKKSDRSLMLHAIEKAYYDREYEKCMELIRSAELLFEVKGHVERESLDKKIRKSAKIERHVTDLLYMKKKCETKLYNS